MRYAFLLFCFCAVFLFAWEQSTVYGSLSEETATSNKVSSENAEHDHAAHGDHGDHEPFNAKNALNPLSWGQLQTDTAFFTGIIFLILVAILGKFAFFPIAEGLKKREQSIIDSIAGAEKANTDAKELLNQYQQKLKDAQTEVRQILEAGKKEAEQASLSMLEKAKHASEAERIRATKEIEEATTSALQELATKSATLATELAGKMIKTQINPDAHRDLINQAIQDFAKN